MPEEQIKNFLAQSGWSDARHTAIAGDASQRSYRRLSLEGKTAVLMVDPGGQLHDFLTVAGYLDGIGLRPPKILSRDEDVGLCLMEDFGPTSFADRIALGPQTMAETLQLGLDVAHALTTAPPIHERKKLRPSSAVALTQEGLDWLDIPGDFSRQAMDRLEEMLTTTDAETYGTSLRDFHVGNLMWCADGEDLQRAGLLDFQDAVLAPPIYDIVSLIADPRRTPVAEVEQPLLLREAARNPQGNEQFFNAFNLWSLQRNLRVAGIFHRLVQQGRQSYAAYFQSTSARLAQAIEGTELAVFKPLVAEVERRLTL